MRSKLSWVFLPNIRKFLAPYFRLFRARLVELLILNPTKGEITLGLLTLAFGLYFLLDTDYFSPAAFDRPPYIFLAEAAPQAFWAWGFILLGAGFLASLFFDCNKARRFLSLILAGTWAFLAAAYFAYDGYIELGVVAVLKAISAAWTFFQVGWKQWRDHA